MRNLLLLLSVVTLLGCAQPARYGMVEDPKTGLMWGSTIERNIVIDASQFENRTVKFNLRNVSGDTSYDLSIFRRHFLDKLRTKGFSSTEEDDFGIKFDVNVLYSGYVRKDLSSEFAFLGGAAGGIAGYQGSNKSRNMAAGIITGATLGAIAGSYTNNDTYITVTEVTIAIADQHRGTTEKTITFSASPPLQEVQRSSIKPFEVILRTKIAVYAGGRNTTQEQIAKGVRDRLMGIVADTI